MSFILDNGLDLDEIFKLRVTKVLDSELFSDILSRYETSKSYEDRIDHDTGFSVEGTDLRYLLMSKEWEGYYNTKQTCEESSYGLYANQVSKVEIEAGIFHSWYSQKDADTQAMTKACEDIQAQQCPKHGNDEIAYFAGCINETKTKVIIPENTFEAATKEQANARAAAMMDVIAAPYELCIYSNNLQAYSLFPAPYYAGDPVVGVVEAGSVTSNISQRAADVEAYNLAKIRALDLLNVTYVGKEEGGDHYEELLELNTATSVAAGQKPIIPENEIPIKEVEAPDVISPAIPEEDVTDIYEDPLVRWDNPCSENIYFYCVPLYKKGDTPFTLYQISSGEAVARTDYDPFCTENLGFKKVNSGGIDAGENTSPVFDLQGSELSGGTRLLSRTGSSIDQHFHGRKEFYVPPGGAGEHTFYISVDDAAYLYVNGRRYVKATTSNSGKGSVILSEGYHLIDVTFAEDHRNHKLHVKVKRPGEDDFSYF